METSSGRDSARPSICFYFDDSQMELQRLRESGVSTSEISPSRGAAVGPVFAPRLTKSNTLRPGGHRVDALQWLDQKSTRSEQYVYWSSLGVRKRIRGREDG
jgi:hypothetical protein